ncbi:MAG: hypothetical protein JWM06_141 [Actinomycetia bacterium]|nr:hypothetical protein [Actinomycetes bacterium]
MSTSLAPAADRIDRLHTWLDVNQGLGVWLTGFATLALALGVIFAWFSLRDARKTRHAQLVADFSKRWDSEEILASSKLGREFGPHGLVELTNKLYGPNASAPPNPSNLADWYQALMWPNLLETVGVMVHDGALPRRMVYRMWGGPIIDAWRQDFSPAIAAHRQQKRDENIFRYFEWLAGEMEAQRAKGERIWRMSGPVGAAISDAAYRNRAAESADSS